MKRFLMIRGIDCGGLIALFVVLGFVVALIGCQNNKSSSPSSSNPSTSAQNSSAQNSKDTQSASSASASKEPDPINLGGGGQMVTDSFSLESGAAIFEMSHQGGRNFIVTLLDKNGGKVSDPLGGILANKIGPFQGSQAIQAKSGQYVLDVQADGPWTITINQPRPTSAPATTSFNGNSTTATDFFQLSKGLKTFQMSHQGSRNFIVKLLDKNGAPVNNPLGGTLVNQIGTFDGSKAAQIPKDDIYLLQVEADGPWSIEVQ